VARSAIVGADAYTTPVRLGDTVQTATGETAEVTAIEEHGRCGAQHPRYIEGPGS
jgi:hypothetical protein